MRAKNKKRTVTAKIFMGILFGSGISLIVLSACALIITKKDISVSQLPVMIVISCALGSAACAYVNAKKLAMRGIVAGLLSAALLTLVYVLILLLVSGFSVSGWLAAIIAADLITGAVAGIIAKNIR